MLRVHCAVHELRSAGSVVTRPQLHRVSATIARGKRPVPFRTRKLSLSAPMVLLGGPGGRVGRRRTFFLMGVILTNDPHEHFYVRTLLQRSSYAPAAAYATTGQFTIGLRRRPE